MEGLELASRSPEQTHLLGRHLGELAREADVFLLIGELGTGKTCLVQGIADGLAVEEYAFSPSFVILREYQGRLPLYHIDLYRLERPEEIADLGLEEYFYSRGVCVIEWAERAPSILPEENLLVTLRYVAASETGRCICLKPHGERYRQLSNELTVREEIWS